jgi:hypothetical protein
MTLTTRTLQMDHVMFEVFDDLEYRDEDGTLVACAPDTDFANLRCSVNSVFQNGVEVPGVAERMIPELALKADTTYETVGDKLVVRTQKVSSQSSGGILYFCHIGLGGHIAVLSVFVDHRFADDPRAKHVLDCADLLVQSFRRVQNS